jgi:hypothetical protein
VDIAVIALWLGHESIQTTHGYIEADLLIKEQALQKLAPAGQPTARFKPDDALLRFLEARRCRSADLVIRETMSRKHLLIRLLWSFENTA